MQKQDINITSLDHQDLKGSLISFLQSTGKFDDFNYEGSSINTIIDLLVRNTQYDAYLANMLANESFIASAQLRQNVVSHAEKLSYITRSSTASRLICDIEVIPGSLLNLPTSISLEAGTPFTGSADGQSYTFTTRDRYILTFSSSSNSFKGNDVELFQGTNVTNQISHTSNTAITVPNISCDTSTLNVSAIISGEETKSYNLALDIDNLSSESPVYFLSENTRGEYEVSFGRNIIGIEPPDDAIISLTYVATQNEHAIGVTNLTSGSLIGGFGNIQINVTTPSYGGSPKEDIESVRFNAPKYYQSQGRALTDSDYIPLIKRQFPFVRSAISWGGERNVPPAYGSVFISILSEQGGLVTNAVKQQMQSYLTKFNVGSITPVITDPEEFGIDVNIAFAYDNRLTNKSFNGLSSLIVDEVHNYNTELFNFDMYYNEAQLNKRLMSIQGVTSVDIDKVIFKQIRVLRFGNPVYIIGFDNEIKPNTIMMTGFVSSLGSNHKLYDNGLGKLIVEFTDTNEQTVKQDVGVVNYATGEVEFTINMIQDSNNVTLYASTVEDNFYVTQNKVIYINDISTSELQTKNRITSGTTNNG